MMKVLSLGALSAIVILGMGACSGGNKHVATETPSSTSETSATAPAGTSTAPAGSSSASPGPQMPELRVTVLPSGTIVADGGIVIEPADATTAAESAPPTPTNPATETTGVPAPLPTANVPPPPLAAGNGNVRFSQASIAAPSGQTFDVAVQVAEPSQPYRGYQWTIHGGGPLTFVRSAVVADSPLKTCITPTNVGVGLTLGGCLDLDSPTTYQGSVEIVTYRCDAPGEGSLLLVSNLEGNGFGSDLATSDGTEFGTPSSQPVEVTCT